MLGETSDHDVNLIPRKGRKEGRKLGGSVLDPYAV